MKIEFTIQSPKPFMFVAEVADDIAAWRILGVLAEGQNYPVSHKAFISEVTKTRTKLWVYGTHALLYLYDYSEDDGGWGISSAVSEIYPGSYPYGSVKKPYEPEPEAPWPIGPTLADM